MGSATRNLTRISALSLVSSPSWPWPRSHVDQGHHQSGTGNETGHRPWRRRVPWPRRRGRPTGAGPTSPRPGTGQARPPRPAMAGHPHDGSTACSGSGLYRPTTSGRGYREQHPPTTSTLRPPVRVSVRRGGQRELHGHDGQCRQRYVDPEDPAPGREHGRQPRPVERPEHATEFLCRADGPQHQPVDAARPTDRRRAPWSPAAAHRRPDPGMPRPTTSRGNAVASAVITEPIRNPPGRTGSPYGVPVGPTTHPEAAYRPRSPAGTRHDRRELLQVVDRPGSGRRPISASTVTTT